MQRKRRTRYIWLPMLGADINGTIEESESVVFEFQATSGAAQGAVGSIALFPLLEDTPQEPSTTGNPDPNITDFIGTDYVVKRLVGKCFIHAFQSGADTPPVLDVTAGIFVARADEANPLLPIGATTTTLAVENYDPNFIDNVREPWMWRRSWRLSNTSSTNAAATNNAVWPKSNAEYGSVMDGPHIDCKSVRRIRGDERLFFACTARNASYGSPAGGGGTVNGALDLRALGALRRAKNRSSF